MINPRSYFILYIIVKSVLLLHALTNHVDNDSNWICNIVKGLSHCQEFGYDMRRINNSPHVVGKSKRCCRMSAVVVHCRHVSHYCRGVPTRFLNSLKIFQYSASKVGGAILVLISQLTRTMSYSCPIHCRLLSCVLAVPNSCRVIVGSLRVTYDLLWYDTIIIQRYGGLMTTSLRVFSTTVR